jgi:hypothetical protein
MKVPHLRNVYQKLSFNNTPGAQTIGGFGITHDGSDSTLFAFLGRNPFGLFKNDTTRKSNLSSFVQCFDTGMAPAVGYTRTLVAANVTLTTVSNDWAVLESQAVGGTNIDLIVKGTIDGRRCGLLYQPGPGNYKPDTVSLPTFTRAQLTAKIQAGDTLSIMGVPPGSGQRMGIDRNLNGVLDADEPLPSVQIEAAGNSTVVSWPASAAGFLLEETPGLAPPSWTGTTGEIQTVGSFNYVTNSPIIGTRFFRLRMP